MIDYEYYSEVYYGEKLEDGKAFKRLARKAEQLVDRRTYGAYRHVIDVDIQDMIKLTICELIDNFHEIDKFNNLSSKSLGDYSVSYDTSREDILISEQSKIIRENLSGTGLLPTNSIFNSAIR